MTRDELMTLYRKKIAATMRADSLLTASTVADRKAAESMLAADIEAGFAAELEWATARKEENDAHDAFRKARAEYMAEVGNPIGNGTNPKVDDTLLAAISASPTAGTATAAQDAPGGGE